MADPLDEQLIEAVLARRPGRKTELDDAQVAALTTARLKGRSATKATDGTDGTAAPAGSDAGDRADHGDGVERDDVEAALGDDVDGDADAELDAAAEEDVEIGPEPDFDALAGTV